jgi:hypothetical protein
VQKVCSNQQTCSVLDTIPLRTIVCKCPPDTVADEKGNCQAIRRDVPACERDTQCPDDSICRSGNCVLACRATNCGINAQCEARRHQAFCTCPLHYEGDPMTECRYKNIPPPAYECIQSEDCPDDRVCSDNRCINTCADRNACGRGAICHIERHQVICRCPQNYNGDPNILCSPLDSPRVGCRAVTECSKTESCINGLCASPCNCGENSDCTVTDHIPVSFSKIVTSELF